MNILNKIAVCFGRKQKKTLLADECTHTPQTAHINEYIGRFNECRRRVRPTGIRRMLRYLTPRLACVRSRYILIQELKVCLFRFEIYDSVRYEECLEVLCEYLREHRLHDELLYIYNTSIHYFRRIRDTDKLLSQYQSIIAVLEKRLTTDNRNMIAKYYTDMALVNIQDRDDIATAIENLMTARTYYTDSNTPSGILKTQFQMACLYILAHNYPTAIDICESALFPHVEDTIRRVMNHEIPFLCIYILTLVVELGNEPYHRTHPRAVLRRIRHSYRGIDDYDHYMFLLNVISSVEGVNIDHFNHEVSSYHGLQGRLYPDDRIYQRIITEIRRKILRLRLEKTIPARSIVKN